MSKIRKDCKQCGKIFFVFPYAIRKGWGVFCSTGCRADSRKKEKIKKVCFYCKKEYFVYPFEKDITKCCSKSCLAKSRKGEIAAHWKGGISKQNGRIFISSPSHPHKDKDGYVRRSRLVMERHIKRYLMPEEVVHHANRIQDDDRIENLCLFKNQSEHMKNHKRHVMPSL